jgi:hypothetical protein
MKRRPSLEEVLLRRAELIERAAFQRARMADDLEALRGVAAWVDRGADAINYLRSHPLALGGAVVVVLLVLRRPLLRGGGLVRAVRRGFVAWRTFVALRALALRLAR